MEFNPNNNIIKLCLQGMELEGKGKLEEARRLFLQAWNEASNTPAALLLDTLFQLLHRFH
jgi:hypothetical protein